MSNSLYVGNLAPETTEDHLRELFASKGKEVKGVSLAKYSKSGKSRGFGFVELASEEEVAETLESLAAGVELAGRTLKLGKASNVKMSERPTKRESSFGGRPGGGRPRR